MIKNIKKIIQILDEIFQNPKTELYYKNEFQLLVAIIMSAQTTDKQVNKINKNFFEKFSTPKELFELGEEEIKNNIKTIGLYNSKAKNIFLTAKMLLENYNSQIPENLQELQKLPGVGVKTAKVWLSIIKNSSYLAVDTHVHRVLNRLGVVSTKTPIETDKVASKKLNGEDLARLHHTLILFGRYYCLAKNPKCNGCKLFEFCSYKEKNI
ncbi:MAG: endonuclease III [Candidatus Gracilibacteria bacterium]|nr:endonuclease III [Candidatus Gracilibacteria bacterium]